jgi:phosphate:Na+ symporter
MSYSFIDVLKLLGALCIFIFGMKTMNDGIQKAAGSRLRKILSGMTSNRFMGVLTGLVITVLLQTSSGTTVMTVSFVNAGLLSLTESMGVIMGANIGTTFTAWIISIFGFKMNVVGFAIICMGLVLPFYFHKNKTYRSLAEFVIGFGILFIGIEYLKNSVPDIKSNPEILSFLERYAEDRLWSVLLFVLIGTLLTVVVQSSSAATAITFALIAQGYIDFKMGAAIFLGENIGTTVTANLAAIVGNVHAKRAARFHLLFNLVGVIWVLILFTPFLRGIDYIMTDHLKLLSPFTEYDPAPEAMVARGGTMLIAISIFHSMFNVLNVVFFIGFIPLFEKAVIKIQPAKSVDDEAFHLEYIGSGLMGTPELSLLQAKKEVAKFGKLTSRMNGFTKQLLFEQDKKMRTRLYERVKKYEEITDRIEVEVANYLTRVSQDDLSEEGSAHVRGMLSIVNDLERIGDIYFQMSKNIERKIDEKLWFTQEQRENLKAMFDLLEEAFKIMIKNISGDFNKPDMISAKEKENEINKYRNKLRKKHLKSIEEGDYNVKAGMIYNDLFSSCEKVGDHIINVSEAMLYSYNR